MHAHAELIARFYQSFARRDAEGMAACYHPDVEFSDPAFPALRGRNAGDMWRMLVERGKDLVVESSEIQADDASGSARWVATYTFSKTGRKVVNRIRANFTFKDGLIVRHRDEFDFRAWSKQALGLVGLLFGGTSWLQKKVQGEAAQQLARWQERRDTKSNRGS